jgi:hypothetical protein
MSDTALEHRLTERLRQSTLDEYNFKFDFPTRSPSPPPTGLSFLSLPPAVRRRIYAETDAGVRHFFHLNYWAEVEVLHDHADDFNEPPWREAEQNYRYWADDEAFFPFELLEICRTVHSEVEEILYSRNVFAVDINGPGGLSPLEALSNAALGNLAALIVSLRPCDCITPCCAEVKPMEMPHPYWFWETLQAQRAHRRRLGTRSRRDRALLAQWRRICQRIAENTRPGQLALYLTSDVDGIETARAIVEPLLGLPALKQAAVSFRDANRIPHSPEASFEVSTYSQTSICPDLRQMARQVALQLAGQSDDMQGFRFLDLPMEIQLLILKQTSLVSSTPIHCHPSGIDFNQGRDNFCSGYSFEIKRHYADTESMEHFIDPAFFCRQRGAAFWTDCDCCNDPKSYFVVSKAFSRVAREVFYGENDFFIRQPCIDPFLHRVSADSLRDFTNLVFDFPPFDPPFFHPGQKAWASWQAAVNILAREPRPRLRLVVQFHYPWYSMIPTPPDPLAYRQLKKRVQWGEFERVVATLKRVKCLRSLRVLLPPKKIDWILVPEDERRGFEKKLERSVMGEDYDSEKVRVPVIEISERTRYEDEWWEDFYQDWWS